MSIELYIDSRGRRFRKLVINPAPKVPEPRRIDQPRSPINGVWNMANMAQNKRRALGRVLL